jgi:hypothetical protein
MSEEFHPLGVSGKTKAELEAIDPGFLNDGLWQAREKTIAVVELIRQELKVGITEEECRKITLQIFSDLGVTKHWHRPYIRLGPGTTLTFNEPVQTDYQLQDGDAYYVDLGPVWPASTLNLKTELTLAYEGDYGDTFVFGENPVAKKMAEDARELFALARTQWLQKKITGQEMYSYLHTESEKRGYRLRDDVKGHRISDFPHHKYTKGNLADFIHAPTDSLWVLEVEILHATLPLGAFFEDILSSH